MRLIPVNETRHSDQTRGGNVDIATSVTWQQESTWCVCMLLCDLAFDVAPAASGMSSEESQSEQLSQNWQTVLQS